MVIFLCDTIKLPVAKRVAMGRGGGAEKIIPVRVRMGCADAENGGEDVQRRGGGGG
jgi:hypothetical protein